MSQVREREPCGAASSVIEADFIRLTRGLLLANRRTGELPRPKPYCGSGFAPVACAVGGAAYRGAIWTIGSLCGRKALGQAHSAGLFAQGEGVASRT